MANQKDEGIDRSFKYLLYSRALRSTAMIYMSLAFSLYLTALGVGVFEVGIIAAAAVAFMVLLTMAGGFIGDRVGYRVEMLVVEFTALAGVTIVAFSTGLAYVVAGIVLLGLGGGAGGMRGAFAPGTNALIANNYADEKRRIRAYSVVTVVSAVFSICGSIMFGLITPLSTYVGELNAYRYMFAIAALLIALSVVSIAMLKESKHHRKTTMIMKRGSISYSLRVMAANSLGGAGIGLAIPLLPLWFKLSYGATPMDIGIVFGIAYIATALGAYASAMRARALRALEIASYTRAVNGAMLIIMALSPFFALAAALYIVRSAMAGLGGPSRSTVNVRGISAEDYGTATSVQGVAMRMAQLSSAASGYLMEEGLPLPLVFEGVLQLLSGLGYKLLLNRKGRI